ncbi:MAG: proline dehydrogenase family protein [Chloroflexi bacterium]|nr:proline dehydrogenase family protein [Chloroflexota bacterium]
MRHDLLRNMAWRYVAGESVEDAIAVAQTLNSQGLRVTLDHLGESVTSATEAAAAADDYLHLLDEIAAAPADANISLKLTQLGLDVDPALAHFNLSRVLERARLHGRRLKLPDDEIFVRIDMESSAYTDRTLSLHAALWDAGARNVGVVLQAALYRTGQDTASALERGVRVRLCKGAYLEPAPVAHPAKSSVDRAYAELAEQLLLHGRYPAFATHDERLIHHIQDIARRERISPDRFELQMLFGIRRDLQLRLARQGYRVRVYVPYGRQWYPYLARRLAERPANVAFFLSAFARESLLSRSARSAGAT